MTSFDEKLRQSGKGLALIGLAAGLATGFAAYGVTEFWIDDNDNSPLALSVLIFLVTGAIGFLFIAERDRLFLAAGAGALIAAGLALPDYFLLSHAADEASNLTAFPAAFWFGLSRILALYLAWTLIKSAIEGGAPPPYQSVFFHGLTIPIIIVGAKLFAILSFVLLFAWAALLKSMDVGFFNRLFQEPWFMMPFLGAIGGVSIGMMRGQQSVLGALRFILLLLSRILTPITALFTITFLAVLAVKGAGVIYDKPYPAAIMVALSFVGMLIFNGVYQNGEGAPPPLWLRLSAIILLIGFPVYSGLALHALILRIGEYGLTPPRIAGLAISGLAAAYSLVCLAGLASELNWRAKRWMPLVGQLNILMAALWIAVLVLMASPVVNLWAISAQSQYRMLATQKVSAEDFDFGYLKFELGRWGADALQRLEDLDEHPEIETIRARSAAARTALSKWELDRARPVPAPAETPGETADEDGPMGLPLSPLDDDEADAPDEEAASTDVD